MVVVEHHGPSTPTSRISRRFRRSEPALRPTEISAIESTIIDCPVVGGDPTIEPVPKPAASRTRQRFTTALCLAAVVVADDCFPG